MALEFSDLDLDEYQVGGTLCLGFDDVDIRILRPRFDKFIACFQAWLGKKNELQTSLTHQHRIHVWYVYSVIYIYIYTKIYVPIYQYVYTSSINPLGLCIPQVQFNKTLTH